MKQPLLLKNAGIVNEGKTVTADVLIEDGIISSIGNIPIAANYEIIEAKDKYLFPGVIDAQVHFREPCLPRLLQGSRSHLTAEERNSKLYFPSNQSYNKKDQQTYKD